MQKAALVIIAKEKCPVYISSALAGYNPGHKESVNLVFRDDT